MILPKKQLSINESYFGFGAFLLEKLTEMPLAVGGDPEARHIQIKNILLNFPSTNLLLP